MIKIYSRKINVWLPPQLHDDFHKACEAGYRTPNTVLKNLIEDWTKAQSTKSDKNKKGWVVTDRSAF